MRVIDKSGKLYQCVAWYPLADPVANQVYQPGELVRVDSNSWLEGQSAMILQVEVVAEKPKPEKVKASN